MIRIACSSKHNILDVMITPCHIIIHASKNGILTDEAEFKKERDAFTGVSHAVEFVAKDMLLTNSNRITLQSHIDIIDELD